jgi:hypothetical protein
MSTKEEIRALRLELKKLKVHLARQMNLMCWTQIASSTQQSHKDVLVEIEQLLGLTHIASPTTNDIRKGLIAMIGFGYIGDVWPSLSEITQSRTV